MLMAWKRPEQRDAVQKHLESMTIPPGCPRVVKALFSVGQDSSDDDAVWIWVILEDRKKDWTFRELRPLTQVFENALTAGGITAIPYVRYRTESEQRVIDELNNDPPDGRIETF